MLMKTVNAPKRIRVADGPFISSTHNESVHCSGSSRKVHNGHGRAPAFVPFIDASGGKLEYAPNRNKETPGGTNRLTKKQSHSNRKLCRPRNLEMLQDQPFNMLPRPNSPNPHALVWQDAAAEAVVL